MYISFYYYMLMEHENLIKARKEKGFTQKEMAEKLAMEQTTYSKKERGITRIRENEWLSFAKILGKDVAEIKNKTLQNNTKPDHKIYLDTIEIVMRYAQKLEEENLSLKNQLKYKIIKKERT